MWCYVLYSAWECGRQLPDPALRCVALRCADLGSRWRIGAWAAKTTWNHNKTDYRVFETVTNDKILIFSLLSLRFSSPAKYASHARWTLKPALRWLRRSQSCTQWTAPHCQYTEYSPVCMAFVNSERGLTLQEKYVKKFSPHSTLILIQI